MKDKVLLLSTTPLDSGALTTSIHVTDWEPVHHAIDCAFLFGGAVRLMTEIEVEAPRSGFVRQDAIEMLALPGKFRLIVSPFKKPGERSHQREWWEPGTEEFRGMELFGDNEYDSRTVCKDVRVANALFSEFFTNRAITQSMIDSTLSVWTPKA
jgi:hypothetical protein